MKKEKLTEKEKSAYTKGQWKGKINAKLVKISKRSA
jgi:hypothetical protein